MRRPKFSRWIRLEILRISNTARFNLRRLAARAQQEPQSTLAAALYLNAYENDCVEQLMGYIYDEKLIREYESVGKHLGGRSVERLALRGTPMMSLPEQYREVMASFDDAYHTPERIAEEKRELCERAREAALKSGASPTELAEMLGVDRANVSAFLSNGETHRLNMEAARKLADFSAA